MLTFSYKSSFVKFDALLSQNGSIIFLQREGLRTKSIIGVLQQYLIKIFKIIYLKLLYIPKQKFLNFSVKEMSFWSFNTWKLFWHFFHKNINKLVFLWPILDQKCLKGLINLYVHIFDLDDQSVSISSVLLVSVIEKMYSNNIN